MSNLNLLTSWILFLFLYVDTRVTPLRDEKLNVQIIKFMYFWILQLYLYVLTRVTETQMNDKITPSCNF